MDGWMDASWAGSVRETVAWWMEERSNVCVTLPGKQIKSIKYCVHKKKKQYAPFKIILKRKKKMILFHLF